MLNKALFQEFARMLSHGFPKDHHYSPMELLIRDNVAATLEQKLNASIGGMEHPIAKTKLYNFVVGHPEHGFNMQCSMYHEPSAGGSSEFRLSEGFSMLIVNQAPPAEEPARDRDEGGRFTSAQRRSENYNRRLDARDFDPDTLAYFKELLSISINEVMLKAIPDVQAKVPKEFAQGTIVYRLHCSDKVQAAHMVETCGVTTMTAQGDMADMSVYDIARQKSVWVHSSEFGNELEWNKARQNDGNRARRVEEFEGATDAEISYIQGARHRIEAILRG